MLVLPLFLMLLLMLLLLLLLALPSLPPQLAQLQCALYLIVRNGRFLCRDHFLAEHLLRLHLALDFFLAPLLLDLSFACIA